MAHNLKAAIDDMKASIEGVDFSPKVELEDQQKGAKNLVTIIPSSVETEYNFGSVKMYHTLSVRLYCSATSTDPATVQDRCRKINEALAGDRKRGGNAQTTITADWDEETYEGRSLVVMVSEPQIQTIETC